MSKTEIKPFKNVDLKIYAYELPEVPSHDGYIKIGQTTREVKKRVLEQTGTAGLTPEILFEREARKSDGTYFNDKELHRYLMINGISKKNFNGYSDEWFYFNGNRERAEVLVDKFIEQDYDEVQIDVTKSEYYLRDEQEQAVKATLDYINAGIEPKEFLWNAKPRFGKTLTTYDLIRKLSATNVLIVTNRPAIANSWFDDFKKFISWQEQGMKFISATDALKAKAMTRNEFEDFVVNTDLENVSQITFLSLQKLKKEKFAGGNQEKLKWISELKWDLLVVDEAHEGVDTFKTDKAFDKIDRKFTLHLSGTPFKAIANNKFNENQIYNWSYLDEQQAKLNWDNSKGENSYENLPTLSLFTYQMSKMIEDRVSKGLTLDDETNVDFAFDLNEFFRVKDDGKFVYEASVLKFLDNLSSGKFPFAEGEHRDTLNHTFWLLPLVNCAKAMEKLLKRHPVFKDYEIVLAAGDGLSLEADENEIANNMRSFDKVKQAIASNKKTITLSVGQLTTGVTIPEWTAVLMLNNIKSPSLYFQAAFRAQNPYVFEKDGELLKKENAYVFDFAPERTLLLFDEFANNLSTGKSRTTENRKEKIKKLLNFFPVIGEDAEGNMCELDATDVLTIPTKIASTEVVKRGFMSNLLFANITGIFVGNTPFKEILDKIKPEKNKRLTDRRPVNVTDPMLDEDGEVEIPKEIVINSTKEIFGEAIYQLVEQQEITTPKSTTNAVELADKINESINNGFNEFKVSYGLNKTQTTKVQNELNTTIKDVVQKNIENYQETVKELALEFETKKQEAEVTKNEEQVKIIVQEFEQKKINVGKEFTETLNKTVSETIEKTVEQQIEKVEEKKKKTTEDDVRDHLRGFARTIPAFLMAYGNKDTTLSTFDENIDEPTFIELTSITIEEFKKLRDGFIYVDEEGNNRKLEGLFNEVVFNASIKEFFDTKERLSNYFDETLEEDIFDFIPPQQTNQIFTPRRVVNLMLELVEKNNPDIFNNPNLKFIDLYAKSGLYIVEIIKRLYVGLEDRIPNHTERIKWIIQNQVYVCAPTNIIYNIVKNYVLSNFDFINSHNIIEFDPIDLINSREDVNKLSEKFGDGNLKFDVIIGNPPYQEMDGGAQASAVPIYQNFVRLAKQLNPELISFIVPSRWYVGGRGLDDFRDEMLNDVHLKELHDWLTPEDIFPNTNIRGGVCYFLWDKNYNNLNDLAKVVTYENNAIINDMLRPIKTNDSEIFIRDGKGLTILDKILTNSEFKSMQDHVSSLRPFGFRGYFTKDEKFKSSPEGLEEYVICYGKGQLKGYVDRNEVTVRPEWIDKWKVFIPRANNIGTELSDDNLNTFIGEPKTISTESYLAVGANLNLDKVSAENLSKYFSTKFVRYLHGVAKGSQDAASRTFRFVPLLDFTNESSVDWSKSVEEIDKQLYSLFGLSSQESLHIESRIKPM